MNCGRDERESGNWTSDIYTQELLPIMEHEMNVRAQEGTQLASKLEEARATFWNTV